MACLLTSATAVAESRVALVVGNGDYSRSPDLSNPANDARAMAKTLRSLDFRLVGNRAHVDVSRDAMLKLLDELEDLLEPGATALVFYSGHGVAEDGTNWLVPVNDDAIRFREDVRDRAVGVDSVLRRLQGRGGGINIVILDACRNNPLPRRHESRNPLTRGLGRMDTPSESVIVYAAAPGRVAYDGTAGSLSPFTGALIEAMRQPGRELMRVLGATAAAVRRATAGMPEGIQDPWIEGQPTEHAFYFKPGGVEPPPKCTASAYEAAERINTEAAYRLIIDECPNSIYAELAAEKLKKFDPWPPGRVFRDCAECPEMVVVPAGSFEMGSPASEEGRYDDEGPQRRVTIARPFAVGRYEVTRGEFGRFVSATGRSMGDACWTYESGEWEERSGRGWRSPGYRQTDRDPVVCASWDDARAYAAWLSGQTGQDYRLLSESEWEYAARAGTRTSRWWGDGEAGQCSHANGYDRTGAAEVDFGWTAARCSDGYVHTSPAGSFEANGFGLHDMLGNVWEWVEDCWHDSYSGRPSDGRAWTTGGDCSRRVLRGGSWSDVPRVLRSADRIRGVTGARYDLSGFRVARTLAP